MNEQFQESVTIGEYLLHKLQEFNILNNHGYGTERQLQEGRFNDIEEWHYSQLPAVLSAGQGFVVRTEGELDAALKQALAYTESFTILDTQLGKLDRSPALMRLAERLSKQL